ncbi:MAG: polysaccharide lyase [Myxococcota bacterium]|nr:polysaccharide lyase [Myxococcota bacterium]
MRAYPKTAKSRGRTGVVVCLAALAWTSPAAGAWVEIFSDDFETGELSTSRWAGQASNPQEGITLAEASLGDPVHSGDFGVEFRLAVTDPADEFDKRRSELLPRVVPGQPPFNADFGPLYRYEFSLRLPEDWSPDGPEIVAQWHGAVDVDSQGNPTEPRRSPPISLRMTNLEIPPGSGQFLPAWDARIRWDAEAETAMDMSTVTSMNLLDPVDATNDLGVWVDWALEVRWDWHPSGSGEARLYKDGVLIADHSGPNAFNDARGPNSKIGLYKWNWDPPASIQLRVAHYDDVRISIAAEEIPLMSWPGTALLTLALGLGALGARRAASDRAG